MRIGRVHLLAATLLSLHPAAAFSQAGPTTYESLRGIPSLSVAVEDLGPEVRSFQVNADILRTDAELKLRSAGIKVAQQETLPYLLINVTMKSITGIQLFAIGIDVSFKQRAFLSRDPTVSALATTWSRGGTGEVGAGKIEDVRSAVSDYVSAFANDFLAANQPK